MLQTRLWRLFRNSTVYDKVIADDGNIYPSIPVRIGKSRDCSWRSVHGNAVRPLQGQIASRTTVKLFTVPFRVDNGQSGIVMGNNRRS